jgi:hypothetical protein
MRIISRGGKQPRRKSRETKESRLKMIAVRDNPDGNEMWWDITGPEIDTAKQITAEIH